MQASAIDRRAQFMVLYRDFLLRLVDLEVISAGGDVSRLFVQFGSILGGVSIVLALMLTQQVRLSKLPPEMLAWAMVGHQEFLIASTMAVVGLFAVVSWNTTLPDLRDSLLLSLMPLRTSTMMAAKVAAVGTGLGICVVAVNAATGLIYPMASAHGFLGGIRGYAAYWLTMAAAGIFLFCSLLAVQGVAALVLSYRLFLRISPLLQLLAFFVILAGYFLTPGTSVIKIGTPQAQWWMERLPSYWFMGLFQELNGAIDPLFHALAARALVGLVSVIVIGGVAFTLAYTLHIRRMIEQPDITPGDRRRPAARMARWVVAKLLPKPVEQAILLFAARTLMRSRQHRIILAAYAGVGLAIAVTYSRSLLYGYSRETIWQANVPLTAAGLVLLFFLLVGVRATFALPVALKANWIFRITAVHSPKAYFSAVRKTMLSLGALPVWIVAAVVYVWLWPPLSAIGLVAVLIMAGVTLTFRLLLEFRKVPFACSYLPGKTDLKFKLGGYGILFLAFTDAAARMIPWMLQVRARAIVLFLILTALLVRAYLRWRAFSGSPYEVLQFEDLDIPEVSPLDLRNDGAFGRVEQYIDVISVQSKPPLGARIRIAAIYAASVSLGLAVLGVIYEQLSERDDRRRYPPVGQMVNIGPRSLHLFCTGQGSPAVIFETGVTLPGLSWTLVQSEVAGFTRACWYDRAGFGWSDASPGERTAADIADDLHALLKKADVPPPYVLVGHSSGGFTTRVFWSKHKQEVAGMVLADPADEYADLSREPLVQTLPLVLLRGVVWSTTVMAHVGIARLLDDGTVYAHGLLSNHDAEVLRVLRLQVKTMQAIPNERLLRDETFAQVKAIRSLEDLPLIVVSGGKSTQAKIHPRIVKLSSKGRHAVAVNSGPGIPLEEPAAIVEAVRDVVQTARAYRAR